MDRGLRNTIVALAVASTTVLAAPSRAGADESVDRVVHFLVDVSGSMSTNARLERAKEALNAVVPGLGADTWAGLRTFGTGGGCGLALDIAPGPVDIAAFGAAVDGLFPSGLTPLAEGLAAAAADLAGVDAADKQIVLLADGDNNCGGDPCAVAAAIAATDVDLVVHTAGIEVGDSARQTLECVATATGGSYVDVTDPADLEGVIGGVLAGSPIRYAALGDSFAAGEGIKDYFEDDRGRDNKCHRSSLAWPFQLNAQSAQIEGETLSAACTGATTADLWLTSRHDEQPQVDRLREWNTDAPVDLVTIMAGGNDVGFSSIVTACLLQNPSTARVLSGTNPRLQVPSSCGPRIQALRNAGFSELQSNLVSVLRAARSSAPDATIALVSYPQLLPENFTDTQNCGWLSADEHAQARSLVGEINLTQWQAVQRARELGVDAVFVDITDALAGRELCTANSAITPILSPRSTSYSKQEMGHPDSVGHILMSQAVFDSLISLGVLTN